MLLELLYRPQLLCVRIVKNAILAKLVFFVMLPVWFKYGWGTLHILNIVWTWTFNHNKHSKHVNPITDSQTVQTDRLGHATNSKFCLRNTAVVCRTALWQVASVVCSFYWWKGLCLLYYHHAKEVFKSSWHLLLRVWWWPGLQMSEAKFYPAHKEMLWAIFWV